MAVLSMDTTMTDPLHPKQKQFTAEEYQTIIRFLEYNIERKLMSSSQMELMKLITGRLVIPSTSSSQMELMKHLLCEARNRLRELFNEAAGGYDE